MKTARILTVAAILALAAAPATLAQPRQGSDGAGPWHQRFEQMDRKLDEARGARGPERRALLREHTTMMHEHMQAMQGMMGPMGRGMMGGNMQGGPGAMQGGADDPDRFRHMQDRLDLMQGMMEQMRKQQELMLRDGD